MMVKLVKGQPLNINLIKKYMIINLPIIKPSFNLKMYLVLLDLPYDFCFTLHFLCSIEILLNILKTINQTTEMISQYYVIKGNQFRDGVDKNDYVYSYFTFNGDDLKSVYDY